MATKKAAAKPEKQSDMVKVTLAHPLRAIHAVPLGLENRDYDVEEDVEVRRDNANSLKIAGLVVIDPEEQAEAEANVETVTGDLGADSGNK